MHRPDPANRLPIRVVLLLLALFWLAGCATLRHDVPRKPSYAVQDGAATPLGRLSASVTGGKGESRFRLLESGRAAFAARLHLADAARRSLDLQYYIFRADLTGKLLMASLLDAADRGVRIRLLLDDMNLAEDEALMIGLDTHPNVEIRLFNPFRLRGGSALGRAFEFLGDASRLNRRMHNKLFIADNQMAITGGRNVGDEYFQANDTTAFHDLDVLAAGGIVGDMSAAFDDYWNSEFAIPARGLPTEGSRQRYLRDLRETLREARQSVDGGDLARFIGPDSLAGDMNIQSSWLKGEAEFLHDIPGKAADTVAMADLPMTRLLSRGIDVRRELLVSSPYFVPGQLGRDLLQYLRGKGVAVRVLTNSLAANDVPAAHAGYARYRVPLVIAGVELYELKPLRLSPPVRLKPGQSGSRASLHTKSMVFDREVTYIGSMNLDPRSVLLNTEAGLLIRSPGVAERVTRYIERAMSPRRSYRVRLNPAGATPQAPLVWLEETATGPVTHDREPEIGLGMRFIMDFLSGLPIEEHL